MRFKTDWVSLIIGSKFTVFALCYFVFEGNFPSTSPRGGLILGRAIYRRVFCLAGSGGLYLEGLIFGILRYVVVLLWFRPVLSTNRPRMQDYREESKLERTH